MYSSVLALVATVWPVLAIPRRESNIGVPRVSSFTCRRSFTTPKFAYTYLYTKRGRHKLIITKPSKRYGNSTDKVRFWYLVDAVYLTPVAHLFPYAGLLIGTAAKCP